MERKKFILFDFDGTVGDTVAPVVSILNELRDHFGYPEVTDEIVERLADKRNQEALKETGLPPYKVILIARRVWKEMKARMPELKPISGMVEVLEELKESGYRLGIVTTGSRENVILFLETNGIKEFEFVDSDRHFFGKHKVLRKVLKRHRLRPEDVVYVGDQTSDIEAARKVGIKIVAVGWGFNSERILLGSKPDAFIKSPRELLKVFQSL